ncbi:hypothetical protein GGS24DRAFT_437889 [Hypoxylon argillaceum]|nr:hypothetical protein GGS24DRAFT_437889 [Hypoxylon argillaceum]
MLNYYQDEQIPSHSPSLLQTNRFRNLEENPRIIVVGLDITMAKSSRASSRKANNQRLKAKVFGPVETERNARLSAKLLELAAAPKPEQVDSESMNIIEVDADTANDSKVAKETATAADEAAMDVDTVKNAVTSSKSSSKKGRVEKRRKASKIVFPKYGDKARKKRNH